ncbi:class F sortase [Streptomyces candidus]|uniref:LPXTG-site transpeptidase (Sortase) family protein n=1 Tax=Streptomyces candidus TaxID=67283 RepID=A0A7X0HAW6_9ACTN|nr:class F sortase [Streptomyces candidus]MBB6434320.1 LPXTG-site transpeptidase (sortase) family protein [Streptomyces candidus]GHH37101.1 class F sortase [Streptomyces candidus]
MNGFRPRGRRSVHTATAIAFTTTALALLAEVALSPSAPPAPPESVLAGRSDPSREPPQGSAQPLPASRPEHIDIPEVGLSAKIVPVGTTADGAIAMPKDADRAGWYNGSPTPGEYGNTLVVGHLDSANGPAAFYRLGALRKGDRISLTRQDGTRVGFTVTRMAVHPKGDFPSRSVYAPTSQPQLTLITCADWDDSQQRYRANLVVTGHL